MAVVLYITLVLFEFTYNTFSKNILEAFSYFSSISQIQKQIWAKQYRILLKKAWIILIQELTSGANRSQCMLENRNANTRGIQRNYTIPKYLPRTTWSESWRKLRMVKIIYWLFLGLIFSCYRFTQCQKYFLKYKCNFLTIEK